MNITKDILEKEMLELEYAKFESEEEREIELEKIHKAYDELELKEKMRLYKRPNKYKRKLIDKKKKQKLKDTTWMYIRTKTNDNGEKYLKRNYYSGRRNYVNKLSEENVRNYKGTIPNGGSYRKLYSYYWNII